MRQVVTCCFFFVLTTMAFTSCKDSVDESNMYSFTGNTVTSYLSEKPAYSEFYQMLQTIRLSDKSKSTIAELLSARGNYTVFVPTNEAVHAYVDSIMGEQNYDISMLSDSIKEHIVRNSIIDNGDFMAYKTTDFNIEGALGSTNMNDLKT